jgi:hypothetical protein
MTTYKLSEPVELNGHWFLPGNQSDSKAGRLHFSNNEFALHLVDTLEKGRAVEFGIGRLLDVIHGYSEKGEAITLLGSRNFGESIHFGSAGLVRPGKFIPDFAIVGAYIDDPKPCFKSIRARVPGLLAWREVSATEQSIEFDPTGQKLEAMGYRVRPVPTSTSRLNNLPGQMSLLVESRTSGHRFGAMAISNDGWVRLQPETPQSIDWYLQSLHHILSLFGLIAGPCMHSDTLLVEFEDGHTCSLLFRNARMQLCGLSEPHQFFISATHLSEHLPALVDTWLALMPKMGTVNDLFQSVVASDSLWLHVEFLSLMHVLEGMHRASREGLYMDDDEYKAKVRSALTNAIPAHVGEHHRESLKSRIKYGNQLSLAKRLAELAESLPESLRIKVLGCEKGVPRRWVDTRHYYTHWDEELKPSVIDGAALYYVNTRLRMFVRILLLRMIGIEEDSIEQALVGTSQWAQELIQFAAREAETE